MSRDVEVIQVIKTRLLRRGSGQNGETMRIVEQYWDMNGDLLWEVDTWTGVTYSPLARDLSNDE